MIREIGPSIIDTAPRPACAKIEKSGYPTRRFCHGRHLARGVRIGRLGLTAGSLFHLRMNRKSFLARRWRPINTADKSSVCRCLSTPGCCTTARIFWKNISWRRRAPGRISSKAAKTILAREHDPQLVGFSAQFKQYEGLVCNMMEFILGNGGALWDPIRMVSTLDQTRCADRHGFRTRPYHRRNFPPRRPRLRGAGIACAVHPGTGNFSPQLALRLGHR